MQKVYRPSLEDDSKFTLTSQWYPEEIFAFAHLQDTRRKLHITEAETPFVCSVHSNRAESVMFSGTQMHHTLSFSLNSDLMYMDDELYYAPLGTKSDFQVRFVKNRFPHFIKMQELLDFLSNINYDLFLYLDMENNCPASQFHSKEYHVLYKTRCGKDNTGI